MDNRREGPDPRADTLPSPDAPVWAQGEGADDAAPAPAGGGAAAASGGEQAGSGGEAGGSGGEAGGSGSPNVDCLTDELVLDYSEGRGSDSRREAIQIHIDTCPPCYELVRAANDDGADVPASGAPHELTTFNAGMVVKDRYLIQRFVGNGGMGEVYEAFDRLMQRRVALKTLLCTAADHARAVRKLLAEVVNAQRVNHPNVCQINELQEHEEYGRAPVPFFTMEFIDGERLGARLQRQRLGLWHVRVIARQLLEGLRAAHAKGVLHLDFKSDNVMLRSGDGPPEAVIMDFGLSRALNKEARVRASTSEGQHGAGTLWYMSVEQLECRCNLGPAADVYAFGVVLYEMLTGHLPFQGESLSAILLKQLRERPPPPSSAHPRLNPAVDAFVLKCLARDASSRYADAGVALAALDQIKSWEGRGSAPRSYGLISLGALVLCLVGGAALMPRGKQAKPGLPANPQAAKSTAEAAGTSASPTPEPTPALGASQPEAVSDFQNNVPRRSDPSDPPKLAKATPSARPALSRSPKQPAAPPASSTANELQASPPSPDPAPPAPLLSKDVPVPGEPARKQWRRAKNVPSDLLDVPLPPPEPVKGESTLEPDAKNALGTGR